MTHATDEPAPPQTAQQAALSSSLRGACHWIRLVAIAWLALSLGGACWDAADRSGLTARASRLYGLDPESVTTLAYWSGMAVFLLARALTALIVVRVWRLTRIYLQGRVFSLAAAAAMRSVATTGLGVAAANVAARPIMIALIAPALLAKLPPSAWVAPGDAFHLLFFGLLLALSVICRTAAEIASEHAQFV
jgi:hypothetical protein